MPKWTAKYTTFKTSFTGKSYQAKGSVPKSSQQLRQLRGIVRGKQGKW